MNRRGFIGALAGAVLLAVPVVGQALRRRPPPAAASEPPPWPKTLRVRDSRHFAHNDVVYVPGFGEFVVTGVESAGTLSVSWIVPPTQSIPSGTRMIRIGHAYEQQEVNHVG